VEFVLDTILSIDREARRVTTQAGGYNYDWYFAVNGVRDQVKIELVRPLDNVFTKPVAAKTLAEVAVRKNIRVTPLFDLAQVNAQEKTIESHRGEKVGYDLLVAIPPNMGDQCLID
jgi:sulfide:quinone oxidoreductase